MNGKNKKIIEWYSILSNPNPKWEGGVWDKKVQ